MTCSVGAALYWAKSTHSNTNKYPAKRLHINMTSNNESECSSQHIKTDDCYTKIELPGLDFDSHAIFGSLCGKGQIERFDVYHRVTQQQSQSKELIAVDIRLGNRVSGHENIVHGGIIALLFDEAMGCAYEL